MPRHSRLNLARLPQHIVQRGNNRQPCFFAEDDYRFICTGCGWGPSAMGARFMPMR
jgi:putative transposase